MDVRFLRYRSDPPPSSVGCDGVASSQHRAMGLFDRARAPKQEESDGSYGGGEQMNASEAGGARGGTQQTCREVLDVGRSVAGHSSRVYNPYEGLAPIGFDARALHEAYRLPAAPEYLFTEEARIHRRGWSENLTYYSGVGYLAGVFGGAGKGLSDGLKSKPETGIGRRAGNVLGVLGLFYALSESGIIYLSDGLTSDTINGIAAGATTGALFKLASGPRTAAVASVLGASAAAALQLGRHLVDGA